jgi:pilus assembly protein Flp/PilA
MIRVEMLRLLTTVHLRFGRFLSEDRGQGLTEYALILALIAVVAIAAMTLLGGKVSAVLSTVARSL